MKPQIVFVADRFVNLDAIAYAHQVHNGNVSVQFIGIAEEQLFEGDAAAQLWSALTGLGNN